MEFDLRKLGNNYFEAGNKNAEISNTIFLELARQLFALSTFYLIFTATLFSFLADKLNNPVWWISVKTWLTFGIICGTISTILGLVAIFTQKIFLSRTAKKYYGKLKSVNEYIKSKNKTSLEELPDELKIDWDDTASSRFTSLLVILQALLFLGSVAFDVVAIIGSISR
jgi:hypothetical protein